MAFKTKEEMFGDGAGFGPAVPYSVSNPPGTSAGNRGIQFGEQLTAAISNRSHFALAVNDEDLNTRLASFETNGLDAAYDNGTAGPPGSGRYIEVTHGAVETNSALASMYSEDRANAHFRANRFDDIVRGGGGFEVVGWGRGSSSPLYGFMDRRAVNFSGVTVVADTISSTLAAPGSITVGAGQLRDGGGLSHLILGYDMIEVLSGPDAGLYVLNTIASTTACTVLRLDGNVPSFTPGVHTIRVFRVNFGSFNKFGQGGTHGHQGVFIAGGPGTDAALDLVPGSTLGRFVAAGASLDGARYALRAQWKQGSGAPLTVFEIDSQGQARSYVNASQLSAAELLAKTNFGAPAFVVQQDEITADCEVGYLARSNGALEQWFGFLAAGDVRTAATPAGVFAFEFINNPSYNIDLTDIFAADNHVNPLVTLFEILTPSAQAGVYLIEGREAGNGRLNLLSLEGSALSLPVSGFGTGRALYASSLGNRFISVGTVAFAGALTLGRAGAVISSPRQIYSTALLLEAGGPAGISGTDFYSIRAVTADDGESKETFSVSGDGDVSALRYQSRFGEYAYKTARGKNLPVSIYGFTGPQSLNYLLGLPPTALYSLEIGTNSAHVVWNLDQYLRSGMVITDFQVRLNPGIARSAPNNILITLSKVVVNFGAGPYVVPVPVTIATVRDNETTDDHVASPAAFSETVSRGNTSYFLTITFGNTALADSDLLHGIQLVVNDPGPINI